MVCRLALWSTNVTVLMEQKSMKKKKNDLITRTNKYYMDTRRKGRRQLKRAWPPTYKEFYENSNFVVVMRTFGWLRKKKRARARECRCR